MGIFQRLVKALSDSGSPEPQSQQSPAEELRGIIREAERELAEVRAQRAALEQQAEFSSAVRTWRSAKANLDAVTKRVEAATESPVVAGAQGLRNDYHAAVDREKASRKPLGQVVDVLIKFDQFESDASGQIEAARLKLHELEARSRVAQVEQKKSGGALGKLRNTVDNLEAHTMAQESLSQDPLEAQFRDMEREDQTSSLSTQLDQAAKFEGLFIESGRQNLAQPATNRPVSIVDDELAMIVNRAGGAKAFSEQATELDAIAEVLKRRKTSGAAVPIDLLADLIARGGSSAKPPAPSVEDPITKLFRSSSSKERKEPKQGSDSAVGSNQAAPSSTSAPQDKIADLFSGNGGTSTQKQGPEEDPIKRLFS
jgi:phage shock protein A